MATTFYLRSANIGRATYNRFASLMRGGGVTSLAGTTTSGGTWISLAYFCTKPLVGFTFSGSASVNLRGDESNGLANATLGCRFYKLSQAGSLSASLGQANGSAELQTTETAVTGSVTPTSTAFANGDMMVMEIGITNFGTMGNGRTVNFYFNGTTAAASGDSYITLTENVVLRDRALIGT